VTTTNTELRLGTFNYKRGGWSETDRRHDFSKLLATLNQAPLPHVLALTEATMYHEFHQQPLWDLVNAINLLSIEREVYYPFLSQRTGSRNHPLLLVAASVVKPLTWELPGRNTRAVREHVLTALVHGRTLELQAVHWDGGSGPNMLAAQAYRTAQLAAKPAILLGDFNCTSSADGEELPEDWHERHDAQPHKRCQKAALGPDGRWHIYPHPLDYLRQSGFLDAGEQAENYTVTTNDGEGESGLRIDRILWSRKSGARLVPGSYHVFTPPRSAVFSDHRYVVASVTWP
jgi:endonuclease/exonuclease/phosphatase family metal-dependent hydrolase